MKNLVAFLGILVVVAAIAFFGRQAWAIHHPAVVPLPRSETSTYTVNSQALDNIRATVAGRDDLDLSVALTDLQTGESYHYGDSSSFTAASVGKLITATAFMNAVEKGDASLTDTIGGMAASTAIQKMLVESDNGAWTAMKNRLTLDGQQAYAESIGIRSYDADANTITSSDIALLLAKLASGKLLTSSHTNQLLSYMEQANYRAYIVAAIPDGTSVYHKVGLLEDRLHDAAIIQKDGRSYVLVIFSKSLYGTYDFNDGASLFGSITADSLEAFF
jgi:beta-lactamase class A